MNSEQPSKIALITGANKGIGLETARQLGLMGFTVLVGARDERRGKEAERQLLTEGLRASFIRLDVTKQADIDAAGAQITELYGKLDVLINNAAIAPDDPGRNLLLNVNVNTLRHIFETNYFGAFAVTQTVLPLLLKSSGGRIVNVSSAMGSLTLNSNPRFRHYAFKPLAYNASKTALNQLTVHLAHELKDTAIKVNAACPGFTETGLNQFRGTRDVRQAAEIVVQLATLLEDGQTGGFFNDQGIIPW
ncbi:SDR family oxidoreductase [Paenibacillus sp. N3/727]|uniref:SDR family oxidoreductase n=1 Tax=Paenibacillus sp. N3/727 TaxID=2925845 RepID=UPI001F53973F|nr:SDR family oxidoreductase [Paenibacillus sp. N3/727]UNK16186.1 SDR family oxidoreductase [Paenibacillus sp. N3/727]